MEKQLKKEIIKHLKFNPVKPVTIEIDFCPKVNPLFQEILIKHVTMPQISNTKNK